MPIRPIRPTRRPPPALPIALLTALGLASVSGSGCAPRATPAPTPAPTPPSTPAAPPIQAPAPARPARALAERFPDADTARATALTEGVVHHYLWLPEGPWAVHVVEVDRAACLPLVAAVKAGPPLEARAPTSGLVAGALAGINADFFMLPGGTPVGAHVEGGRVVVGPGSRPVYAVDAGARRWAGRAALVGLVAAGPDTAALTQVNRPLRGGRHHPPRPGLTLSDAWFGDAAPVDSGGATLRVRRTPRPDGGAPEGPGAGFSGVVVSRHGPGEEAPLDADHVALQGVGGDAAAWLGRRAAGDTVTWRVALVPAAGPGGAATLAVGGFPVLVDGGRGVYAEQAGVIESFGDARHPRTAVGWSEADGRVWWVVVDGRQAPYSDGMTLSELEALFLRLGATHAVNLDGGGSSTLVAGGRVANRPSDREGERPVANALALTGCGTPGSR